MTVQAALEEPLAPTPTGSHLLARLQDMCEARGLGALARRLEGLLAFVEEDLASLERELTHLPVRGDLASDAARHLLAQGGKRLRPLCVALSARLGGDFTEAARQLAVAVELVHAATLLHDDVVDEADVRRGAPAARVLFGNTASIFAGDWLLVEALRRVRRTGLPEVLDELLQTIDGMIHAEAEQLAARGRLHADRNAYFRIVEGKTASLFRWATWAGARAAGLDTAASEALADYGRHLGIAFQLVDDLLDYAGDGTRLGKEPLADLREGKTTFPLLLAVEREPTARKVVQALLDTPEGPAAEGLRRKLLEVLDRTEALAATREQAEWHAEQAAEALAAAPEGPVRDALVVVAHAAVQRDH